VTPRHLIDIRDAIEAVCVYYRDPASGSDAYDWSDASGNNNLYTAALGSGTDWTRTEAQMNGTPTYDIDMYEVRACIDKLQDAVLV